VLPVLLHFLSCKSGKLPTVLGTEPQMKRSEDAIDRDWNGREWSGGGTHETCINPSSFYSMCINYVQ